MLFVFLFIVVLKCVEFDWSYDNATNIGPASWHELSVDYKTCNGSEQSPINIVIGDVLPKFEIFETSIPKFARVNGLLHNDDRTVEFTPEYPTAKIKYGGTEYPWRSFHHHYPSEHAIDGVLRNVELHFVHHDDAEENIAVLGFLFEEGATENAFLKEFEDLLPETKFEADNSVEIDFRLLLGEDFSTALFYHYKGSYSSPPCTEGVDWFVYSTVLEATAAQLDKFNLFDNVTNSGEMGNSRPLMNLTGRTVTFIDGNAFGGDDYDTRVTALEEDDKDTLHTADKTVLEGEISDNTDLITANRNHVIEVNETLLVLTDALDTRIDGVVGDVNTLDTDLDDVTSDLDVVKGNLSALCSTHETDKNALQGQIDTLDTTVSGITTADFQSQIDGLTTDLDGVEVNLTSLLGTHETDKDALQGQIDTLDTAVTGLTTADFQTQINGLTTDLDGVEVNLTSLLGTHETDKNALQGQIDTLDATVSGITTADFQTQINGLTTDLGDLDDRVDSVNETLHALSLSSDTGNLQTQITAVVTDLSALDDDVQGQIDNVTSIVVATKNTVAGHTTQLTTLSSNLGTAETTIAGHTTTITGHTTELGTLTTDLDTAEADIAALTTSLNELRDMFFTTCGGKDSDDKTVCSGRGICVKMAGETDGKCYCSEGYGGNDCSYLSMKISEKLDAAKLTTDDDEADASGEAVAAVIIGSIGLSIIIAVFCVAIIIVIGVVAVAIGVVIYMKRKKGKDGADDDEVKDEKDGKGESEEDKQDAEDSPVEIELDDMKVGDEENE